MSGVRFAYPLLANKQGQEILTGVNLSVYKGDMLAIIGPNGSGKSTLVKHFNGLEIPTAGRVSVMGLDTGYAGNLIDIRRRVGVLFQNPDNQLVSTIVEEDVAFGPENLALETEEIRRRVEYGLAAVQMTDYRDQSVHTLSGGQKQRVAIAGLLAMEPDCLVLDEPTSMLDPQGRKRLFEILRELNAKGITIVFVTHLMEEALQAKRVCIFNNGNILLEGPPKQIFQDPEFLQRQNLEVPQINILAGMLRESGVAVPDHILNLDEMVDFICTYRPRT